MRPSTCLFFSLAATAIAAPVATVTVHKHVQSTVVVSAYVFIDGDSTSTSYLTLGTPAVVSSPVSTSATITTDLGAEGTSSAGQTDSTITATAVAEQVNPVSAVTKSTEAGDQTTTPTSSMSTTQQTTAETLTSQQVQTSTSQTSAQSTTSGLSTSQSEVLSEHNIKRALHEDTPSLTWSDELASYAQAYADEYDCSGTLTHSGGAYGENLALGYSPAKAVDAWYNEIDSYDFSSPGYSSSTGHFTQLVWKSSTELGCGFKTCGNEWGTYVICSYNPAGNVLGEFSENVESLK